MFLTDGGQPVEFAADRLVAFLAAARSSLDVAIYDAHFDVDHHHSDQIVRALNDAETRGVSVRVVFNDVDGPGPYPAAEPHEGPSAMTRVQRAVPSKAIDGRYDLMHHKYAVRDAADVRNAAVWTGSTNWTTSSFTRMENIIVTIPGTDLAAAYTRDSEQLWQRREVEGTGTFDDQPSQLSYSGKPLQVRAFFSPGRGRAMSQVISRRIAEAKCCRTVGSTRSSPLTGRRWLRSSGSGRLTAGQPGKHPCMSAYDLRVGWPRSTRHRGVPEPCTTSCMRS